jgi:hypothetical protein
MLNLGRRPRAPLAHQHVPAVAAGARDRHNRSVRIATNYPTLHPPSPGDFGFLTNRMGRPYSGLQRSTGMGRYRPVWASYRPVGMEKPAVGMSVAQLSCDRHAPRQESRRGAAFKLVRPLRTGASQPSRRDRTVRFNHLHPPFAVRQQRLQTLVPILFRVFQPQCPGQIIAPDHHMPIV